MFLTLSLYMFVNTYVCVPHTPSPTLTRSEPLVRHLLMDLSSILTIIYLFVCVTMLLLSKIDLNCRFIPFNTRPNTLAASARSSQSSASILLIFVLYFIIFDHFLIIILPSEFFNIKLDNLTVRSVIFVKMFHCPLASTILNVCYRLTSFTYTNIRFTTIHTKSLPSGTFYYT